MPEKQGRGDEIDYRGVTVVAAFIIGITALAMLAMVWTFNRFEARERALEPTPATRAGRSRDRLPPEPRLQADPVADLAAFNAEQEARLNQYRWLDESAGKARIPVQRAMELVVEGGLPARKEAD